MTDLTLTKLAHQLVTPRLHLRPLRPSDAGPIELHCGDPRVAKMLAVVPHPYPPGAAAAFIESTLAGKRDEHVYAMDATAIGSEELIGVIGVRDKGQGLFTIGYWVGPPFWNTGYASEAARAVVAHLFEQGAEAVGAYAITDNPASAHVLENAGLAHEGEGEQFCLARGVTTPVWLYRIHRSDWRGT